jgi:hypothetical protein
MFSLLTRFAAGSLLSKEGLGMACGYLFGGATLVWVATHVGPRSGTAIVHVTEADVVVAVGGTMLRVAERPYTPFVLEIPAGEHRLVMSRGASVLYDEPFTMRGGDEVVLTAYAPRPRARLRPRP